VNALLRPGYKSKRGLIPIPDRETAEAVVRDLHANGFFLAATKPPKSRFLSLTQYYIWVYQGSSLRGLLIGTGVLAVVLAGVMFPLWPAAPRQGVYYLSLALLGFIGGIMGLGVVRAILWLLLKLLLGRSGWLFPNLFADVGFFESFVPVWSWDNSIKKKVSASNSKAVEPSSDMDDDNE
jgi:translocation protein SEC62